MSVRLQVPGPQKAPAAVQVLCTGVLLLPFPLIAAADEPSAAGARPQAAPSALADPWPVFSVPGVARPAYLVPSIDPTFQSQVMRITNNTGASTTPVSGSWGSDARHNYSKQQPWSSDQSLYVTENRGGSPAPLILDGTTFVPRYTNCANYALYDHRWHPSLDHPHEQINVNSSGTELMWFDVTTCTKTRSWTLPITVNYGIGSGEGNASNDGRFVALASSTRMLVVDMDPQPPYAPYPNRRIGPVLDVSSCGLSGGCSIDWVSISASGKYAVVNYDGDHPRVFDVNPATLALTPHPESGSSPRCSGGAASAGYIYDVGHADLALDPFDANTDVLIGQEHCGNHGATIGGKKIGYVLMVRLSDGAITPLTDPTNEAYPHHVSTRNLRLPGWAFVSHYKEAGKRFSDEIMAVKMDGSLACQRLAHSHSAFSGCYRCEVHPVASPDGQRVVFASNWAQDCGGGCDSGSDIKDYLVLNPIALDAGPASPPATDDMNLALGRIYPNPAVSFFRVSFALAGQGPATLDLIDVAGRRVTHRDLGELGPGRHEANLERDAGLRQGIYTVRLTEAGRSVSSRVVLMH